ncbi:MAG: ABC transporter permease, partial [Candidatus Micrarchaeaceae archaeon]
TSSLAFPPTSFSFRWFAKFLHEPELMHSLGFSFALAIGSSLISLTVGGVAAFGLVRGRSHWNRAMQNTLMLPLMVPALIGAMAFLQYFTLLGTPSMFALLIGHVIITLPYVVRTFSASLQHFDISLENAAVSLGAPRVAAIRLVTLPALRNSVIASALFSFIISFENLPVALFLSGPSTVTLPLRIYSYIQWVFDPTVAAASAIQVVVVVVLVFAVEKMVGLNSFIGLKQEG